MRNSKIATFSPGDPGTIWLKCAIIYLMIGVSMGIAMGLTGNFTLMPVHAHINLLGWATTALAGIIYSLFPRAGNSLFAKIHFWLANIAMPLMAVSLSILLLGNPIAVPVLVSSEIMAACGIILLAINIFTNLKET